MIAQLPLELVLDPVLVPTLACRSFRPIARTSAAIELLPSPGYPGQVLHLNRAMLSDQRSPYVGRFARGWHRLPGRFPGQPQTRTWAHRRIGTGTAKPQRGHRVVERARCGDQMDPAGAGCGERLGTRRGRRPGGEDVIDQQDSLGCRTDRFEAPSHRLPALGAAAPSLRSPG